MTRCVTSACLLTAMAVLAGCSGTAEERRAAAADQKAAAEELREMAVVPRELPRPVILLAGWNDDPALWDDFRAWLGRCTGGTAIVYAPDLRGPGGLGAAADRVVEQFASLGEVDVVAHSVGGLVARDAARTSRGRHLRVARLFTLATPHRGTNWANFWEILPLHLQVRDATPDSAFLHALASDSSSAAMPIATFWFEGDWLIARASAEAVGTEHHVYARAPGRRVHERSIRDPRFARDVIADLMR